LEYSALACLHCYSVGFTQTSFDGLVGRLFMAELKAVSPSPKHDSISCIYCLKPTRIIAVPNGPEHKENLRVFSNWKYWQDHHRNGSLQVNCCDKCHFYWMNARTFCRLTIDWQSLESNYREKLRINEETKSKRQTDPLQFLSGHLFGIPDLENVPSLHELPIFTYIVATGIGLVSYRAFKSPELFDSLTLNPTHSGIILLKSMLTYCLVHKSWTHYFGNISLFLVFAPLVEHELNITGFLLLLGVSAVGAGVLQTLVFPSLLVGASGLVSAIVTFFCFRFPSAIIGFGMLRFSAPVALFIYLTLDLKSLVDGALENGGAMGLASVAGLCTGYLFHTFTPPGSSSKAFKKMSDQRLKKEISAKNWHTNP
jgi:membrane associated rhomboid family serine protease